MAKAIQQYKWIIVVVAVLALAFYWYEWRPVKIISRCNEKALEVALEKGKVGGYERQVAEYDLIYKGCIRKKGL